MSDRIDLRQRERDRRNALWNLNGLSPGDPAALPWLSVLDAIDDQDRNDPAGMSIESLVTEVPVTQLNPRFRVVRDEDLPEPWRTRFEQASIGSTRLSEGAYAHDWMKFIRLWSLEMAHVEAHRAHARKK